MITCFYWMLLVQENPLSQTKIFMRHEFHGNLVFILASQLPTNYGSLNVNLLLRRREGILLFKKKVSGKSPCKLFTFFFPCETLVKTNLQRKGCSLLKKVKHSSTNNKELPSICICQGSAPRLFFVCLFEYFN